MHQSTRILLFLDDAYLLESQNITRVFHQPELRQVSDMSCPGNKWGCGFPEVGYDADRNIYRVWYSAGQRKPFYTWFLLYGESHDGWSFKPVEVPQQRIDAETVQGGRENGLPANLLFWRSPKTFGADVSEDIHESDPNKRFKLVFCNGNDEKHGDGSVVGLAFSADGYSWHPDSDYIVFRRHSDTMHCLRYNPITSKYQIMVRPAPCDRRIAVVESNDLQRWTEPRLVLEPDEKDGPAAQFYAMPIFFYEGIWIGLLWYLETPVEHRGAGTGPMWTQLTWSYDGITWQRGQRLPFIPVREKGEYGHGAIEASSLLVDQSGDIRIYANGFLVDHAQVWPSLEAGTPPSQMLSYALRRDGFCSLRATGGVASLVTNPVAIGGGGALINGSGLTGMQAELCDAAGVPVPGFSFAESAALEGECRDAPLAWKSNGPLWPSQGEVSIRLRWNAGDLYSIRLNS